MTVGVFFVLDNQVPIFPTAPQVQDVLDQIILKAPNLARVTVYSPQKAGIGIVISAQPNTSAVREAIRDSLLAFFNTTDVGMILYKTMLDEAIGLAAGEITHVIQGLAINSVPVVPVGDLYMDGNQLPRLEFLIINGVTVYTDF
jgi:uncharacterized phage protein gp47/JayE